MKSRISNAYVKIFLYMLAGAAVGAVAGAGIYMLLDGRGQELEGAAVQAFGALQGAILPLLSALLVLSVLAGELTCRKLKAAAIRLPEADDEESDRLEYEEEKWGALSLNLNIVSQVLNIIILAADIPPIIWGAPTRPEAVSSMPAWSSSSAWPMTASGRSGT